MSLVYPNVTENFHPLCGTWVAGLEKCFLSAPEGDYYEFGVFLGYGLAAAYMNGLHRKMRFYGFDSFQGLPKPSGIDNGSQFHETDFKASKTLVERNLQEAGVDMSRVTLVEGWFSESLSETTKRYYNMGQAAVVLVDCDLYLSTVPVLLFVASLLQEGTIIMFDDWNCFNGDANKGERKAFREFLDHHREWTAKPFVEFGTDGMSFVMSRS